MPCVTMVTRWEWQRSRNSTIVLSRRSSREAAHRPETSQGAARRPVNSRFRGDGMKDYAPEVRRADEPARSVGGVYATRISTAVRDGRRRVGAARRVARGV